MKKIILCSSMAFLIIGCSPKIDRLTAYPNLYNEKPLSIIVMPPINKSTKVEAKTGFYNTLTMPLAESGYYAFPASISMLFWKEQSAYDAELLIDKPMGVLNEMLGADAVLFTTIHSWRKVALTSSVEVEIEYLLKGTLSDDVLYQRKGLLTVQSSSNSGSALADLATNVIKTALTKEVDVAQKCNEYTFQDMPRGKYSPLFGKDGTSGAGKKEFSVTVTQ